MELLPIKLQLFIVILLVLPLDAAPPPLRTDVLFIKAQLLTVGVPPVIPPVLLKPPPRPPAALDVKVQLLICAPDEPLNKPPPSDVDVLLLNIQLLMVGLLLVLFIPPPVLRRKVMPDVLTNYLQ